MVKICNDRNGDDKWLHFFISFVIGGALAGIFSTFSLFTPICAALVDLGIVILIGVGKEIYDARKADNHFCVWDLLWDFYGAVPAAVLAYLANYFTWQV